jgi:hypothetical protein
MTQFIEPNKKSDLIWQTVTTWLRGQRTGLVSGFQVSASGTGFNVNITSGRVVVKGAQVYDDETRLNLAGLITAPGANNEHWLVYVSYTAADTFPPAPAVIGAVRQIAVSAPPGKPPTPSLPADSVKIADIFVPGGAGDLSTATIVNAPPLPALGDADGDVLLERLVASNANITVTGGGGFGVSGAGPYTVTWSSAIGLSAPPITHRESYGTATLAHASIPAGSISGVPANAILFTHFDRRTPNDYGAPATLSMKFIDLDAPTPAQTAEFSPSVDRDKVVVLGRVTGGALAMTGGLGALPAPSANTDDFLRNDPGGSHYWSTIDANFAVGGLHVLSASGLILDGELSLRNNSTSSPPSVAISADGGTTTHGAVGPLSVATGNPSDVNTMTVFGRNDVALAVNGQPILTTLSSIDPSVLLHSSPLFVGAPPAPDTRYTIACGDTSSGSETAIAAGFDTAGSPELIVKKGSVDAGVKIGANAGVGRSTSGALSLGTDTSSSSVTVGRSGQANTLSGDSWTAPGDLNVNGAGGLSRSGAAGALNIGNSASVNALNIGTSGNTGSVNIGKASGSSLNIGNARINRSMPGNIFEDFGQVDSHNYVMRKYFSGIQISGSGPTAVAAIGWPSSFDPSGVVAKFTLVGHSDNSPDAITYMLDGVAVHSGEAEVSEVAVLAQRTITGLATISTPAGNNRVVATLDKYTDTFDLLGIRLEALSTSEMSNSVWSGAVEFYVSRKT